MERKLILLIFVILSFSLVGITQVNDVDRNSNLAPYNHSDNPLALYDVIRSHNVDSLLGTATSYGVCWIGTHYVTSRFSTTNMFNKITSAWVKADSFPSSGAGTGFFRDLAFANGKIWGSPLSGIVYGINPTTGVCEKTITMSGASQIRGLAWDPVRKGFWCGTNSFTGPAKCYDTNGVAISGAQLTATSIYGIAYDDDPAGPFIWIATDQNPVATNGVAILKYNATTYAQIGSAINLTIPHSTPSTSGSLASGSCEVTTTFIAGKRTFVGLCQGGVDRVYVVDLGTMTVITVNPTETPKSYQLSQNYPNPFNPTTNITFDVPKSGYISLKVYNSMGQEVKTLTDGVFNPGSYTVGFNATGLSSGIYFYKLESESFSSVKKMTLVK